MNRRKFLALAAAAPFVGSRSFPAHAETIGATPAPNPSAAADWRRFEITTRIDLRNSTGPAQLWLPLAQTAGGYQTVLDLHWQGGGRVESLHDARYGAPILRATWDGKSGGPQQIEVVQTVATRDRGASPFLPLTEAERRFWTSPTGGTSGDGIVLETAQHITAGLSEPRAKLRAIYDWVVDHTHRDPDTPGCGTGDLRKMLLSGNPGGKCADINSLMVGLARAAGFPAREVYGLRVAESSLYPCLGRSGDVSKAQHCRAEVFLDDAGWFPLDPADVRKVILEQKLAPGSPEVLALRERLFGFWEMNWIGYNSAAGIILPGKPASEEADFSFLMYPHAVTAAGLAPCLNPDRFHYAMISRVLT